MSDVRAYRIQDLIEVLTEAEEWSVPVVPMELLLAAGPAAVEPLLSLLRELRRHRRIWPCG